VRDPRKSCDATGTRFATGGRPRPDARADGRLGNVLLHFGGEQTTRATGAPASKPQRPSGPRGFPQAFGYGSEARRGLRTAPSTPTGEKTRHESPRSRHDGQATGRGALVIPLGMALLREEAPVGSAGASELRHREDRGKVAGRGSQESLHPPACWRDGLRLGGRTGEPRTIRTQRFGGWARDAPASRDADRHGNRKTTADPHKAKPKGASGDEGAATRPGRNGLHGGPRP
jgi:hypothetical protein